jgi:transposase
LKALGRQRTDSTQVLARVRVINRLECVAETLRYALNSLAAVAPAWLRVHSPAEWPERYGRRRDDSRLPAGQEERRACARQTGEDGYALLALVVGPEAPAWLKEVPDIETLRPV